MKLDMSAWYVHKIWKSHFGCKCLYKSHFLINFYTVKILNIWTLAKFDVITLKFKQDGFTVDKFIQKTQTELQTV